MLEIGARVTVGTIDARVTSINGNMVGVILPGKQFETELFIEEIDLERITNGQG
jgi:hypothetical protein